MKTRMILAAGTFGALVSTSAFAQEATLEATAVAPKMRVGAQVELLPTGTVDASAGGLDLSNDTALAYGVSATFDYAVLPYLSIGVAPRFVMNVKPDSEMDVDSGNQIDLRARLVGHYPVARGVEIYAAVTPGYTILTSGEDGADAAKGFAIGGAAGLTYDLSPKMFVSGEVGYQRAFASVEENGANVDLDVSFLHVGLGAGTRF